MSLLKEKQKKSTIQQKKFNNLLKDKKPQHDLEKIIFNFSSYVLSEAENPLLWKGLNLAFRLRNLIMLIPLSILNYFIKIFVTLTKTKDIALSSFHTYNKNLPQHLLKGEIDALKHLSQNK